jgi:hypothetical protein
MDSQPLIKSVGQAEDFGSDKMILSFKAQKLRD